MIVRIPHLSAALLGALALFFSCHSLALVGHFVAVTGDIKVISAESERAAERGAYLFQGDTIRSGNASSAQIKMADDVLLTLQADTVITITTFKDNKTATAERSTLTLLQGGVRILSSKESYLVKTPSASIDLQGNDHEPVYIPHSRQRSAAQLEAGTYDRVNDGIAKIHTARGTLEIKTNQVGFAPLNAAPKILVVLPDFYRAPNKNEHAPSVPMLPPVSASLAPKIKPEEKPPLSDVAKAKTSNVIDIKPPPAPETAIKPITPPMSPPPLMEAKPPVAETRTPAPAKTLPAMPKQVAMADRRMMSNIKRIGTHPLGFGIYEFDYVWGEHAVGVIADEVKQQKPEVVLHHPSGYDLVDYSKLK